LPLVSDIDFFNKADVAIVTAMTESDGVKILVSPSPSEKVIFLFKLISGS